jgi:hypothetical protein
MDPNITDAILVGATVFSSDDHKVGTVAAVKAAAIHVEKGFFFIKDYEVPLTAIAAVDPAEGHVTLNVTKEVALSSKWEIEDDFDDFVEHDQDNPIDGEGDRVLTGAAQSPSLPIIEELDDDDPPLAPAPA